MLHQATLSDHAGLRTSFSERVALLLSRIDCRLATSDEEREAIVCLRHEAAMRERANFGRSPLTFADRYDEGGNVYLFGLYIDDELASSLRLHVARNARHQFPSFETFADVLQIKLDAGEVIIDSTRFVADEYLAQFNRELPYATLRLCMLAAEHFNADRLIAVAGPQHQAFYRRAFNYRLISEPRPDPFLGAPVRLMMLHYPTAAGELYRRYPFFRSTPAERQKIFGPANLGRPLTSARML